MNKREAIEKIVESFDPSDAEELRRIRNLTKEERRKEYRDICDKIDKGGKEGKCSRKDAWIVKDVLRKLYNQHPNSFDVGNALNLTAGIIGLGSIGVAVGYVVGYLVFYQGIITVIEYFSK